MRHVKPHLWAELASLPPARVRRFEEHAASCTPCAAARDRVAGLDAVFADIRAGEPAHVGWDHVGARIHWARSLERRTGERAAITVATDASGPRFHLGRRARRGIGAGLVAAAAAGALALVLDRVLDEGDLHRDEQGVAERGVAADRAPIEPMAVVPVELAEGADLAALVVMTRGEALIDDEAPVWTRSFGVGQRLRTEEGELVAQFARGGGFALGPHSTLELRSFDSHSIELVLEGTLEVQVSKRAHHQQFVVVAGGRTVSVRGTAFRVTHRDGDLDVACDHGRVEVSEGAAVVGIDGSERLVVEKNAGLGDGATALELDDDEKRALSADLAMPLISAWRDVNATLEGTSTLSVLAGDDAAVTVDGVAVGAGSMELRLQAGRHEVAVTGAGPWAKGRWIELDGGPGDVRIVHANHGGAARGESAERVRRVQLRLALRENRVRLSRCVSRLASHGVASGAYVELRVDVNADGTLAAVNAGESNVDLDVRRCALDAVSGLRLPRGPRARATARWTF